MAFGMLLDYSMAQLSKLGGMPSEETIKLRVRSCFGDEETPRCDKLQAPIGGASFYTCAACGCGTHKPLPVSLARYVFLTCPLRKPGFSNERPNGWPHAAQTGI